MYKKRLAKWGFRKNTKRGETAGASLTLINETHENHQVLPPGEPTAVALSPGLDPIESLKLMVLTGVQTWSLAFFESLKLRVVSEQQPYSGAQLTSPVKEMSSAFKLVVDLLDRGHGLLAGRVARKAFILAEDMFVSEAPILLWNLLEMMHHVVTRHHAQLFHLLLTHLTTLVDDQMPKAHPFSVMLRGLKELFLILTRSALGSSSSASSSSSRPSAPMCGSDVPLAVVDHWFVCHNFLPLLEQAWILNAKILFANFDPRLLGIYYCLNCDTSSIDLPRIMIRDAERWFSQIDEQQNTSGTMVTRTANEFTLSDLVEKERILQTLFSQDVVYSLLREFQILRATSTAKFQGSGESSVRELPSSTGEDTMLLPMLAWLTTAKILQGYATTINGSRTANSTTELTRLDVDNIAFAIKILVDLNATNMNGQYSAFLGAVERIRALVAMRVYASGTMDPQTIREMWLLQDALVTVGKYDEATEIEQEAQSRVEKYIQEIPISMA